MSKAMDTIDQYFEKLVEEIDEDEQELVPRYVDTLDDVDMQALEIAITNLESSFNLIKCSGYVKWKSLQSCSS